MVDLLKRAELAVRGCAEALLVPFGLTGATYGLTAAILVSLFALLD